MVHSSYKKEIPQDVITVSYYQHKNPLVRSAENDNEIPKVKQMKQSVLVVKKDKELEKVAKGEKEEKPIIHIKNPEKIVYEIRPGDRLDKISFQFYKTHHKHREILKANPNLDPQKLMPGKKIVIPNLSVPEVKDVYLKQVDEKKRPYVVKENEVLSQIAEKELGSIQKLQKILEMNPGLNQHRIKSGQTIYIPVQYKERR